MSEFCQIIKTLDGIELSQFAGKPEDIIKYTVEDMWKEMESNLGWSRDFNFSKGQLRIYLVWEDYGLEDK